MAATGQGVVYDIATGDIRRVLDTSPENVEANVGQNEAFFPYEAINPYLTETHRVNNGVLRPK